MQGSCRPAYAYAEVIVDYFLHGYHVDEICTKARLCKPGFFDPPVPKPAKIAKLAVDSIH